MWNASRDETSSQKTERRFGRRVGHRRQAETCMCVEGVHFSHASVIVEGPHGIPQRCRQALTQSTPFLCECVKFLEFLHFALKLPSSPPYTQSLPYSTPREALRHYSSPSVRLWHSDSGAFHRGTVRKSQRTNSDNNLTKRSLSEQRGQTAEVSLVCKIQHREKLAQRSNALRSARRSAVQWLPERERLGNFSLGPGWSASAVQDFLCCRRRTEAVA